MPRRALPPEEGKRIPLNMRTTREIRNRLTTAAIASGRSLAQEVEYRLERSFRDDDLNKRLDDFGEQIAERLLRKLKPHLQGDGK
jgi:hypothetical protein